MSIFGKDKGNSEEQNIDPQLVVIQGNKFVLSTLMNQSELIKNNIQKEYIPKYTPHRNFYLDNILDSITSGKEEMDSKLFHHIASLGLDLVEYVLIFSDNASLTNNPVLTELIYTSFRKIYDRALKLTKSYDADYYSLTGRMELIRKHSGGLCGAIELIKELEKEALIVDLRNGTYPTHDYGDLEKYCLHPTAQLYVPRK